MKDKFYLYTFLLVGLFNLSSTGWSAPADPSEFTRGVSINVASNSIYNINFRLEAGSFDKDNGEITRLEEFNSSLTKGFKVTKKSKGITIIPSSSGERIFILDQYCLSMNELFSSKYLSSIELNGQCEDSANSLIRCSDISIIFNIYDNRTESIVQSAPISCNANINLNQ